MSDAVQNQKNLLRFTFNSTGLTQDAFNVVKFEGEEAISKSYRFDLTLVSKDPDIDFNAVLDNSAEFTILSHDGEKNSTYYGVITEFEQLGKVNQFIFYRALLLPRATRLMQTRINEVFADNQTVPEVVERVLVKHGVSNLDYQFNLKDESLFPKRSLIGQYQETDFDFVSRLLESEGIYYYFDTSDPESKYDKAVILDYKEAHPAEAIAIRYTPREDVFTANNEIGVTSFVIRQTPLPKSVIVQDYDYHKANLANDLKATVTVSETGDGEMMFYGGNLRTIEQAQRQATIRAEALICRSKICYGEANAVGLRSGYLLELSGHFRQTLNDRYLITSVQHRGNQAGVVLPGQTTKYSVQNSGSTYDCAFTAIPADTQFRPERVTPKPVISGTMSALIDSEGSGQMAEMNEYGEYKVQLLYDLSDKPVNKGSAWVRMASPYAGNKNGMHFPLHKGTEVLLSFSGGDPDQPVIMAAAPNSDNQSVANNSNAYLSGMVTPSGNRLTFSDKPGDKGFQLSGGNYQLTSVTDSLFFAGTYSWQAGIDYSMSIGTKVQFGVSAATAINASVKNDVVLGFKNELLWGPKNSTIAGGAMEWIMVGDKMTTSFSKASGKGKMGGSTNSEAYQVVAGMGTEHETAFFAMEAVAKKFVKLTTLVNLLSMVASLTAGAFKLSRQDWSNATNRKVNFTPDWKDYALVALPLLNSTLSIVFYKILQKQDKKLEKAYLTALQPYTVYHMDKTHGVFTGVRGPQPSPLIDPVKRAALSAAMIAAGHNDSPVTDAPAYGSSRISQLSHFIELGVSDKDRPFVKAEADGKEFFEFDLTNSPDTSQLRLTDGVINLKATVVETESELLVVTSAAESVLTQVGAAEKTVFVQNPNSLTQVAGASHATVSRDGISLRFTGASAAANGPEALLNNVPPPLQETEASLGLNNNGASLSKSDSSITVEEDKISLSSGGGQIIIGSGSVSIGGELKVNGLSLEGKLTTIRTLAQKENNELNKSLGDTDKKLKEMSQKLEQLEAENQQRLIARQKKFQDAQEAQAKANQKAGKKSGLFW